MEMFIFFISLIQYKKNSPVQKICVPENFKSGGYLRSVFSQLPDLVKKIRLYYSETFTNWLL